MTGNQKRKYKQRFFLRCLKENNVYNKFIIHAQNNYVINLIENIFKLAPEQLYRIVEEIINSDNFADWAPLDLFVKRAFRKLERKFDTDRYLIKYQMDKASKKYQGPRYHSFGSYYDDWIFF